MINLRKCVDSLQAVYPEKDAHVARDLLSDMVKDVRNGPIDKGDYYFNASYGFHVEKRWFLEEPEPDALEVYVVVSRDEEIVGEDLA